MSDIANHDLQMRLERAELEIRHLQARVEGRQLAPDWVRDEYGQLYDRNHTGLPFEVDIFDARRKVEE